MRKTARETWDEAWRAYHSEVAKYPCEEKLAVRAAVDVLERVLTKECGFAESRGRIEGCRKR